MLRLVILKKRHFLKKRNSSVKKLNLFLNKMYEDNILKKCLKDIEYFNHLESIMERRFRPWEISGMLKYMQLQKSEIVYAREIEYIFFITLCRNMTIHKIKKEKFFYNWKDFLEIIESHELFSHRLYEVARNLENRHFTLSELIAELKKF